MNRDRPDGWARVPRPADGWARAATGRAASAEERLVMAVVALATREETLGADRRNLRGSPFRARSRVAASAATIFDKKIRRVLRSTTLCHQVAS